MTDGLDRYDLATKGAFRRWGWKCLARMRPMQRSIGPYFYLLGPEPRDWRTAHELGIGRDSLIGVSWNADHVSTARGAGLWAVEGGLGDVLDAWHRPVRGVFADLCIPYSRQSMTDILDAIISLSRIQPVPFVINIQRGREQSQDMRWVASSTPSPAMARQGWTARHMGICLEFAGRFGGTTLVPGQPINYGDPVIAKALDDVVMMSIPYSYRSRHVTMDALACGGVGLISDGYWEPPNRPESMGRVAALKAMRTKAGLQ